jgi:ADP-heptose:LPS heptosyltransferase
VPSREPASAAFAALAGGAVRRIAVLRALQVGDLLCAVPALRALRAAFPRAHVTLIGLPWARSFARRFATYIDAFAEFPGCEGMPEGAGTPEDLRRFFAWAVARRFDLALQMHGSGAVSNAVVERIGARLSAGFHPAGTPCPDPRRFAPYPESGHEIRRWLQLTQFIGLPGRGEHLEFPLTTEDFQEFASLPEAPQLEAGAYACVHPGARAATRRWPAERFAQVADALAAQGLRIVITGNGAEADLACRLRTAMSVAHPAPIDLARDISLGALAVVISRARLLVANDTGVSHVAAGVGTPSVIVFTAADPTRWAPLDSRRHRAVYVPVDCRPCAYASCPIGHPCANDVAPAAVIEATADVLRAHQEASTCPMSSTY